ncbi:heparinase II/III family protein [Chitinophaga pinensis]|uniref:Heparinase II/III family protein n=1 Tax=Chitinophaga pinensis (strain ATCC 43595 / DSM 2588 / LMG 13176 / NBRC 15968 / NCIMB 11800 / UQM 2034) TaxID=485918 RepID=A0A979GWF6_CHIPD|nr:heparinase II/III family protein [Chitinophaga pinensis]ACU61969.1 heparinase II/III family protein [Chitinophaga pinensis DSM 2588]
MKRWIVLTCMLAVCYCRLSAQHLLSGHYTQAELAAKLIPQAQWMPFPRTTDREGWEKADTAIGEAVIKKAESYMDYDWPSIPATKSLLIIRTGNRSEYQDIANKRREVLGTLLMAELYENEGRFIDPIINGVWSVCEESFWGVPAHLPGSFKGLMDVSQPFVELFSAETATLLAWVDYFLGPQLDAASPQIRKRIYYETNKRIFEPLMNKPHGWMHATANGRRPNNWNPWICSNWLNAVLLLEKDDSKRITAVDKILGVLDEFLDPYPADGGCDEGPGYWGAAAASLYDNVAMLNLATNNAFDYVYNDKKVGEMGKFIYRAQISERYFLDFADADPQPRMAAGMIYRFGKDIKDPAMMRFGAWYLKDENQAAVGGYHFFRHLFAIFMQDEFRQAEKGLALPADVWWPDLQVMVARDKEGSTNGFFVAAKGGNNDESHNHNDIGNYVVYYDGLPVLIDIGRGTYTAKTFSSKRYDIWYNRSDYHNVPSVNGYQQSAGPQFKATEVMYKRSLTSASMMMNISASYPEAAGIERWQRNIRLARGKQVYIDDVLQLKKNGIVTEHLMTCYPVEVLKPGVLVIHRKEGNVQKDFYLRYPADELEASIEKVPLLTEEDGGVKQKWGENIYRINLNGASIKAKTKLGFTIGLQ